MEQQHNGKRGAPNNNHTLKRAKAIPIPKCYQLNLSNHTELQDELKKISNVEQVENLCKLCFEMV